jgi:molybdopterin molybdotransferase/putative molybdopterin biosynthesis protein
MDFDHITRKEALDRLFARYRPQQVTESCKTDDAAGRVTAADIVSVNRQPVFRASKMDGVAVRSSDFSGERRPDTTKYRLGIDYVRADTGDDFDDAFDAVVMIEDVAFVTDANGDEGEGFTLAEGVSVNAGKNIVAGGNDLTQGDLLIGKNKKLRSFDLTVIARGGLREIPVVKRPVVCFIPTGSELVPTGTLPARGEIIDSNSVLARHMLSEMGAEVITLPIVKDKKTELDAALSEALKLGDIVVINGGSSKGKDDLNHGLLAERGELICHGTLAAPGRPVGIALIGGKPIINVPGPMVACYFVFDWCLRAIIAGALGIPPVRPQKIKAQLTEDLHTPDSIEFLNRLHISRSEDGTFLATPLKLNRAAGEVYILGADSGQFVNAIGTSLYPKGSVIEAELLCPSEFII